MMGDGWMDDGGMGGELNDEWLNVKFFFVSTTITICNNNIMQ